MTRNTFIRNKLLNASWFPYFENRKFFIQHINDLVQKLHQLEVPILLDTFDYKIAKEDYSNNPYYSVYDDPEYQLK